MRLFQDEGLTVWDDIDDDRFLNVFESMAVERELGGGNTQQVTEWKSQEWMKIYNFVSPLLAAFVPVRK
jgi:hypothetical protein